MDEADGHPFVRPVAGAMTCNLSVIVVAYVVRYYIKYGLNFGRCKEKFEDGVRTKVAPEVFVYGTTKKNTGQWPENNE